MFGSTPPGAIVTPPSSLYVELLAVARCDIGSSRRGLHRLSSLEHDEAITTTGIFNLQDGKKISLLLRTML